MDNRYDVELFIVHPTLAPEQITGALGLPASIEHGVGKPRRTPNGTPLPGKYPDTRWRHSTRHTVPDQWFARPLEELVERLMDHKAFLNEVRSTGGSACLIVQFLGDNYFGDEVSARTLEKMSQLGLGLGIECFTEPQS